MSTLYEYTIPMMFRGGHYTDSVEGNQTVDTTNLINKKQTFITPCLCSPCNGREFFFLHHHSSKQTKSQSDT